MEWRQQSSISSAEAFTEARRWIEEVTEKSFMCSDFRAALDNGVLLCDLINRLKPGIIKKVNRLSTPIAGLDNVNLFLKACGKLGLNESQLFHPGDLQDLSSRVTLRHDESHRRLKNVLITIYWLGRKAHLDSSYSGPQLNLRAFEGLLGLALSKSLNEGSNILVKGEEYRLSWHPRQYMGQNSVDTELLDSNGPGINNEGCGSDAEAEQVFRVESSKSSPPSNNGYFLLSHHRKQGQVVNGRDRSSPITRLYKNPVRPERPVQVNPGWIWSKSLSDIPMVYSVKKCPQDNGVHDVDRDCDSAGDWNKENTQMSRVSVKDGEVLWQDHLTKWKNRRRSTKSDHERKSQDREHVISQMTNRVMPNFEKSEAQGKELPQREQVSSRRDNPGPLSSRQCPPTSGLRPHTVALLSRSYTSKAALCPTSSHPPLGPSLGPTPVSD
uniref:Calponin-homology (CH) domain-containing protein n=1 Tax=Cynoglossus semilaevis TaxID=244447 RepID=A0A3P8V2S4_CYNSE